jgi:hypothetical protein
MLLVAGRRVAVVSAVLDLSAHLIETALALPVPLAVQSLAL